MEVELHSKYTVAFLYSNIRVRESNNNTTGRIQTIRQTILVPNSTVPRPYGKPDSHRTHSVRYTIFKDKSKPHKYGLVQRQSR